MIAQQLLGVVKNEDLDMGIKLDLKDMFCYDQVYVCVYLLSKGCEMIL